ncbi:MAG: GmrSD restriction endonuclease domain-containing protein [Sulfobacillus sp.]
MAGSTFQTNPYDLFKLLEDCHDGVLQLPDFQRSWVWDEDRIKSLIASVSRAFPVGALMTLDTGGEVNFKPRPVEGAPVGAKNVSPQSLLLDGQQRMTSLYQVTLRGKVVETVTPKNKKVKRWFYFDIRKALDSVIDREEAIVGVPEDRVIRTDFGREVVRDLSSHDQEFAALMYPVTHVFDWDRWQDGFDKHWRGDENEAVRETFRVFKRKVLENFKYYRVPVISLDRSTSKEAVCVVFEKVNTGGKALDAFELVTAMYAADGHELRKDWYGDDATKGRHRRFVDTLRPADSEAGIIAGVSNTDFLQAISLFYTRERRREAERAGKQGKELPAVIGNRQALLNLPLSAYKKFEKQVEHGFVQSAKFLHMLHVYRIFDLPYQSQIVPLAAIIADIGDAWEHEANRAKLVRWYWNGVFGELYGSAVESRIARDFMEVPVWLQDGPEPSTVRETIFRADRLKTMRMRLSAAYKGVNALLMKEGAQDFRSGQKFDHTVFFGENVDIHHIFPQDWCKKQDIKSTVYDSIINKTPLSFRTNRIIGGVAPSEYLAKLEKGDKQTPAIERERLDAYLRSHLIDPTILRSDNFEAFMVDRQKRLLYLIEQATGNAGYTGEAPEEGVDVGADEDTVEAEMIMSSSQQRE